MLFYSEMKPNQPTSLQPSNPKSQLFSSHENMPAKTCSLPKLDVFACSSDAKLGIEVDIASHHKKWV